MNQGFPSAMTDEEPLLLRLDDSRPQNSVVFHVRDQEIIRLADNGDIFIKGKLVENDKEIVRGLREFLAGVGFIASPPWVQEDFDGPRPNRFERINDE